MRENKFKVWSKALKKHVCCYQAGLTFCLDTGQIYCDGMNVTDNYILRQYTGVYDKNDVEIYEGDIVKHVRYVVGPSDYFTGDPSLHDGTYTRLGHITITASSGVTLNGIQVFEPDGDVDKKLRRYNQNPRRWGDFSEVIGNIYENPELLND